MQKFHLDRNKKSPQSAGIITTFLQGTLYLDELTIPERMCSSVRLFKVWLMYYRDLSVNDDKM